MRYDSIQGTLRYITPGLYFIAMLIYLYWGKISSIDTALINQYSDYSAVLVILIPFVGFVLGFFLDGVTIGLERLVYIFRVSSPDRKILHGTTNYYYLDADLRKLILGNQFGKINSNKSAMPFYQKALQRVGENSIVSRLHDHSVMARNIAGAQLIVFILSFTVWKGVAGPFKWISLGFFAVLCPYYYHLACVYMDHLFAEYGKCLLADKDKK